MKLSSCLKIRIGNNKLKTYSYMELAQATEGFSNKYALGSGEFGQVYKATLSDGELVAIKKFNSVKQPKEFQVEISVLDQHKHENLVKLLGLCCDEHNNVLLVLEFMPNESLESHLHVDDDKPILNWSKRMCIALGSAKGIAYLHGVDPPVIHRDIKPENILLDHNFEPKIADFGLARFLSDDRSRILTVSYGTSGYVAPECKKSHSFTKKSDVFAFGILLLEFITGKKAIFPDHRGIKLSEWAPNMLEEAIRTGNYAHLVDDKLNEAYNEKDMGRMIYCAAASVYKHEKTRPTMSQIVKVLEGKLEKNQIWNHQVDKVYLHTP